jgi:hypothetical protein
VTIRWFPAARWVGVFLVLLLVASACGSDDPSTADDAATVADEPAAATEPASADDSGCPTESFSGALARSASGGHREEQRTGAEMIDAVAVTRSEGIAYTIYLSDYPIDRDELGSTLQAPPGSVLVTFAIDEAEGILIGKPFANTDDRSPFVIIDSGGGATDSATGATGEQTVTGLSSTRICFEIDYQDAIKSISGSVSAEIASSY